MLELVVALATGVIVGVVVIKLTLLGISRRDVSELAAPEAVTESEGVVETEPLEQVLVDGSNVMHWSGGGARIEDVQNAVKLLKSKGFNVGVMFDANAGYRLSGSYMREKDFALQLGLPVDQILVANKGVPADVDLLKAAQQFGAKIVTNDLFRDWAEDFPEVRKRGFLVHGGYHKGKLWLDFDGSRPRMHKAR